MEAIKQPKLAAQHIPREKAPKPLTPTSSHLCEFFYLYPSVSH